MPSVCIFLRSHFVHDGTTIKYANCAMMLPFKCTANPKMMSPFLIVLLLVAFLLSILPNSDGFHFHDDTTSRGSRALHASNNDNDNDDSNNKGDVIPSHTIWMQDAEEDFVDEDENLEDGEICLKSVKAFASPAVEGDAPRFLSAGALVQRGSLVDENIRCVCDAWTADAILEEGGPNLQLQGACLVLDELLLTHLQHQQEDPIGALQTFVVQCGSIEKETSCASYMAAYSRGFRPLKNLLRESSIYTKSTYASSGSLDGMLLDTGIARDAYGRLVEVDCPNHGTISQILQLLPEDDLVQRFTIKRFLSK